MAKEYALKFAAETEALSLKTRSLERNRLMKQRHSVVRPGPRPGSLRYNIAPSQQVRVIMRNEERNILKPMRWGLVPSWTDDKAIWQRLINARAETLRERPSYKRLVSTQRYLIPADGFYEWKRQRNQEVPMWICRR